MDICLCKNATAIQQTSDIGRLFHVEIAVFCPHFFCLSNKLSVMSILSVQPSYTATDTHAVLLSGVGVMARAFKDFEQLKMLIGGTSEPGVPLTVLGNAAIR